MVQLLHPEGDTLAVMDTFSQAEAGALMLTVGLELTLIVTRLVGPVPQAFNGVTSRFVP